MLPSPTPPPRFSERLLRRVRGMLLFSSSSEGAHTRTASVPLHPTGSCHIWCRLSQSHCPGRPAGPFPSPQPPSRSAAAKLDQFRGKWGRRKGETHRTQGFPATPPVSVCLHGREGRRGKAGRLRCSRHLPAAPLPGPLGALSILILKAACASAPKCRRDAPRRGPGCARLASELRAHPRTRPQPRS